MAKEIAGYVKLQIKGGQANPAPPVGPALGQRGLNIMDFLAVNIIFLGISYLYSYLAHYNLYFYL